MLIAISNSLPKNVGGGQQFPSVVAILQSLLHHPATAAEQKEDSKDTENHFFIPHSAALRLSGIHLSEFQ